MAEKRLVCVLGVILFAAGSACAAQQMGMKGPRDVASPIILLPSGEPAACTISFKQPSITSHADKWIDLDVISYCGSAQTVMVGNFRTDENPSGLPTNCTNAMYPATTPSIFQQDDARRRTANLPAAAPGEAEDDNIKLKIKSGTELPGSGTLTYYFDICLNGTKADPRLVIER